MNAILKIYPSKLERDNFETCTAEPGQTFEHWLNNNVPSYEPRAVPLFSASVNNEPLPPSEWAGYRIQSGDQLELVVEAKGYAAIVMIVVAVAAAAAAMYFANQIPDNYNQTTPDGSTIYNPNAQGNQARLMGVVPEIAGRHKVYPDLLCQPRRQYDNNEQYLYLMLCVGVGDYEISADNIYIGNTPVSGYAGDIEYTVFGPGEDVTGHDAHRNFYLSPEVGSSAGQTGLEIEGSLATTGDASSAARWTFSGTTLKSYWFERDIEREDNLGFVPRSFPYSEEEIISISESSNDGEYRVVSKSGHSAQMEKVDAGGDAVPGWGGFVDAQLVSIAMISNNGGSGGYLGPFFACPENETTRYIELDFFLPQGLGRIKDNGDFEYYSVTVDIDYRDESSPTWTTITHTFSNATNDQLGHTEKINIGSAIRPEVRVRRVTEASDDTRIYDTVQWTALRAELDSASSYEGVTTIAVKIRGTNALAGSAENKFNLIPTRKLPVYENGSWSAPDATEDIAPFFAYIIKSVGHSDDQIGLEELEALHELWSARGDTFSAVFDNKSTLFEALKKVLAVGYAEPTLDYGQIIPVRDGPRTAFEHMYQPDNRVGELEQDISLFDPDEPDGVEVEYFDPQTWKPATVLCTLSEDQGLAPKKVRAFGITDETKAWRFGMRQRRIQRYRRTRYSFKTEMDGLNSHYLSYCALADDIPGYSQTGRVLAVSGREITLDADLEWGSGTHFLALRKPDGKLSGLYNATATDSASVIAIDADLDFTPVLDGSMEPPLFMFGEADRWSYPALITDIKPSGTERVSMAAVNYDERVYADDDNSPA
ncbi:host specificity factor TipJ family phage tail protein [Microbulbifer sp. ANSA003]|uniref:host specificity factor TipJ family phage tail protein n=1 Tax=Microbulbifer sp. ANSA003 TaxID=3243360 RepID=UPI0040411450